MKREHKEAMKKRARNIKLTLAYEGSAYHGFQRQTPPVVAVQNILEKALEKIFPDSVELAAAGRTDAGVHALGQVVNFFTDGTIPTEKIPPAVNGLLPADIAVLKAEEAAPDFSARHSAKSKIYLYKIQMGILPDPFTARYVWRLPCGFDPAAAHAGLKLLEGEHDFSSFRASGGAPMSPVRRMYEADIKTMVPGKSYTISFHANGFLYHMVRNIVGTLVRLGQGKLSLPDFKAILEAKDRSLAAPTAPPQGLYLAEVFY